MHVTFGSFPRLAFNGCCATNVMHRDSSPAAQNDESGGKGNANQPRSGCHPFPSEPSSILLLQFCRAVRAAGGIVGNHFFAVRTFSRFFGRCLREETVDLLDYDENSEGHDEEVDDIVQELAIGNDRDSHFLGFSMVETGTLDRGRKRLEKSMPPRMYPRGGMIMSLTRRKRSSRKRPR